MFFFRKKSKSKEKSLKVPPEDKDAFAFSLELRSHIVDDFFIIKLPTEFIPYESDKFRARTEDCKKAILIANYQKPWNGEKINQKFFEKLKLHVYNLFVQDGGYEAYDDLKITDEFIRRSFKVDEETQYYFTSSRIIDDYIVTTGFFEKLN